VDGDAIALPNTFSEQIEQEVGECEQVRRLLCTSIPHRAMVARILEPTDGAAHELMEGIGFSIDQSTGMLERAGPA